MIQGDGRRSKSTVQPHGWRRRAKPGASSQREWPRPEHNASRRQPGSPSSHRLAHHVPGGERVAIECLATDRFGIRVPGDPCHFIIRHKSLAHILSRTHWAKRQAPARDSCGRNHPGVSTCAALSASTLWESRPLRGANRAQDIPEQHAAPAPVTGKINISGYKTSTEFGLFA
jgi:hypothetical protein